MDSDSKPIIKKPAKFYKNINLILAAIVIGAVVIIFSQYFILSEKQKTQTQKKPAPTPDNYYYRQLAQGKQIDPEISPYITSYPEKVELTPIQALYDANNKQEPINKIFFNETKKQFPPGTNNISEGIYRGQILGTEKDLDNTYLVMKSLMANGYGKTIWYQINNQLFNKKAIDVFILNNGQENEVEFTSLKKDNIIDLYEMVDYSQNYPESISKVKIVIK